MGASDSSNETVRKWAIRSEQRPEPIAESDAFVEFWKKCWLSGADARWAAESSTNPNSEEPARAAWQAGWDWAKDHPDRRKNHSLRLAHANRRATDPARRVPRAVKIGAFGVGLFAASRWGWRALRARFKPNSS